MDLLKLGSQARKTGLKARSNITKDKYDMEDIDEFFEDTIWSESRKPTQSISIDSKPSQQHRVTSSTELTNSRRKVLGVGKIRNSNKRLDGPIPDLERSYKPEVKQSTKSDFQEIDQEIPTFADINDLDADEETSNLDDLKNRASDTSIPYDNDSSAHNERQNYSEFNEKGQERTEVVLVTNESGDNTLDSNILDGLENNTTLSPIRLQMIKSSKESVEELEVESTPEPARGTKSGGIFTKNMALSQTAKKRRPRIYESEEGDQESAEEKQTNYSSDGGDGFDSDFTESQYSQGSTYKASQVESYQDSPLPSPPPEGLRRSKRTKIAPLAYWRNERIVYSRAQTNTSDPDSTLINDIRKVPLQEIREVVHIPEASKKKSTGKRGRPPKILTQAGRGRKPKSKPEDYDYESDPEIEGSEWFKDKLMEAEVFDSEESRMKMVVAWSPDGGDFKTGQLELGTFRIATLFNSDNGLVGAGLLEFPLDGFKASQTTGDSLFIFHVAKGLIKVTLSSQTFIVTRGCSFEIPKKNTYDFKNIGRGNARLFFVQCHL